MLHVHEFHDRNMQKLKMRGRLMTDKQTDTQTENFMWGSLVLAALAPIMNVECLSPAPKMANADICTKTFAGLCQKQSARCQ